MDRSKDRAPEEPLISASFYRSLPLFISSALFFAIGAAVLLFDPRYGPGAFTLWALLFALGFVAAIGGVASWLLVEEPAPARTVAPASRPERETLPVWSEDNEPVRAPVIDRADYGRPVPAVHERGGPAPYAPTFPELSGTAAAAPGPGGEALLGLDLPWAGSPTETISPADALKDLEGIEKELVPRNSVRASPPAPA